MVGGMAGGMAARKAGTTDDATVPTTVVASALTSGQDGARLLGAASGRGPSGMSVGLLALRSAILSAISWGPEKAALLAGTTASEKVATSAQEVDSLLAEALAADWAAG
jgi:hypothetical protein